MNKSMLILGLQLIITFIKLIHISLQNIMSLNYLFYQKTIKALK